MMGRSRGRLLAGVAVFVLVVLGGASGAWAGSAAPGGAGPGFTIESYAGPTVFSSEYNVSPSQVNEHSGSTPNIYVLTVRNSGSEPTDGSPITIADTLPKGLSAVQVEAKEFREGENLLEKGPRVIWVNLNFCAAN